MHHVTQRALFAAFAALALGAASLSSAEAPLVAPGSFSGSFTFDTERRAGTLAYYVRDGDVRLELGNDLDERFVIMLAQTSGEYMFQGFEGDGEHSFAFHLETLLRIEDLYAEFVDFFLFTSSPESAAHPCVHTQPPGGVLTGTFSVWDCRVVGSEAIAGRPTTVWDLERLWGREGQAAVFNDPVRTVWIDDALGVPLRVRFEDGTVKLHVELVALDDAAPEAELFLMPEDGGI